MPKHNPHAVRNLVHPVDSRYEMRPWGHEVRDETERTSRVNSVTMFSCMAKRAASYDPKVAIARASSEAFSSPLSCNSTASSVEEVSFLVKTSGRRQLECSMIEKKLSFVPFLHTSAI
jgi:hypothetical protein